MPVSFLVKYFEKVGNAWEICPEIRARVEFRIQNLLDDCPALGTFDVIFCRNVLIYFDEETKRLVLGRVAARLATDGYLVLGAAETTTGLSHDFAAVPEGHHGIFSFTPEAAALVRAREECQTPAPGRGELALRGRAGAGRRAVNATPHRPFPRIDRARHDRQKADGRDKPGH